jgi:hypothetical protein
MNASESKVADYGVFGSSEAINYLTMPGAGHSLNRHCIEDSFPVTGIRPRMDGIDRFFSIDSFSRHSASLYHTSTPKENSSWNARR